MSGNCDCFSKMNKLLVEYNTVLVSTLFGTPRVVIDTAKLRAATRGRPKPVLASFCPFCGIAYPKDQAP